MKGKSVSKTVIDTALEQVYDEVFKNTDYSILHKRYNQLFDGLKEVLLPELMQIVYEMDDITLQLRMITEESAYKKRASGWQRINNIIIQSNSGQSTVREQKKMNFTI